MTYRILKIKLEEGASEVLDQALFEDALEVVGTSTFVDVMDASACPYLVLVVRDIQPQDAVVATPSSISPASAEADVAAFNAWLHDEVEPSDFDTAGART